jgi:hypothetical protein
MSRFWRVFARVEEMKHMRTRKIGLFGLVACVAFVATAAAQYGHPIKGQWSGDWGPNANTRNRVLLDLDWTGKAATGVIHAGEKAITLTRVTAEPVVPAYDAWTVRMEGPNGLAIDGKIVNLGSANRTMSGTWTEGGVKGTFNLTRN